MKKIVILSLLFIGLKTLAHSANYGTNGFQTVYKSTTIDIATNHRVLSTGCIHVGYVVPLSTRTGSLFSVADSSNRAFDYYEATTFSLTGLEPRPIFKTFERGFMINNLNAGGDAGGAVSILYNFEESSCYDLGSQLDR